MTDETGEIFNSQCEASRKMNIRQPIISDNLNGIRKTAKGYTFVRIPYPKFNL